MSGEPSIGIGAARLDLIVDGSQLDVAISAAKNRYADFSQAGQQALANLTSAQRRQVDSLIKQADTIGYNKAQMIAYAAATKGLPVEVIDDLKAKLLSVSSASDTAGASIKQVGDSLKGVTLSDSQLYRANQALADYKQTALEAAAAARAAVDGSSADDARYRALARAGAQFGASGAAGGAALTEAEIAAKQAQTRAIKEAADARDRERIAAKDAAEAQKAAAAAAQAEQQSLQKLLNQIDPVNAALTKLDTLEAQLRAARAKGTISQDDFDSYAAKIAKARQEVTSADHAMGHFTLTSAGARRELGVLVGELARGDFSNLEGSLLTLANRAGVLTVILSPIGLIIASLTASLVAMGVAAVQGAEDQEKLNRAIIETGNFAGVTSGQVNAYVDTIGRATQSTGNVREALTLLIASGKVTGTRLAEAAQGAADFSFVTGQAIDKSVEAFVKLQDDPVKAIRTLDEQYHVLTLTQYENIKALEAQGDASTAAAIAQTAAAQSFAQRAAEVRQSQGLIQRGWDEIKASASAAWDAMKGIGRTFTNGDDLSSATKQLDAIRNRMPQLKSLNDQQLLAAAQSTSDPNHAFLAGDLGTIRLLIGQKQSSQAGALFEQWQAQREADFAKINEDAKKASDVMTKYLDSAKADQAKAAEIAKVKDATASLIAANPQNQASYLADQKAALAEIEKKYTNHDANAAGKADESAQVAAFKSSLAAIVDAYKNGQAELDASRKAGAVSEADYYQQSRDLLWKNEGDQVTAIQAEIDRLKTRKAVGAERIKLDGQIAQLEAQASKVEADAISKSDQLAGQQQASYLKRQQAIDAYREALDKANDTLQAQVNAEIARIGMGDRQFQLQQSINKALEDQANKMQDLALKFQAGTRGESGGIDQSQYDADVAALQAATDKRVAIITEGYRRQTEAQQDWEKGAERGLENWVDQAGNAASQATNEVQHGLDSLFDFGANKLTGQKAKFSDFITGIEQDLIRLELRVYGSKILSGLFPSLFGGGGGASGIGDLLNGGSSYSGAGSLSTSWAGMGIGFNALGNVFTSPDLSRFSGTVVEKPTFFRAYANGGNVMGEAGPEGIFPLTRTSGGKLGVQAVGSVSGVAVELNVSNNGQPVAPRVTGTRMQGNRAVVDMVLEAISSDIATGGKTARAIQTRFGVNSGANL